MFIPSFVDVLFMVQNVCIRNIFTPYLNWVSGSNKFMIEIFDVDIIRVTVRFLYKPETTFKLTISIIFIFSSHSDRFISPLMFSIELETFEISYIFNGFSVCF